MKNKVGFNILLFVGLTVFACTACTSSDPPQGLQSQDNSAQIRLLETRVAEIEQRETQIALEEQTRQAYQSQVPDQHPTATPTPMLILFEDLANASFNDRVHASWAVENGLIDPCEFLPTLKFCLDEMHTRAKAIVAIGRFCLGIDVKEARGFFEDLSENGKIKEGYANVATYAEELDRIGLLYLKSTENPKLIDPATNITPYELSTWIELVLESPDCINHINHQQTYSPASPLMLAIAHNASFELMQTSCTGDWFLSEGWCCKCENGWADGKPGGGDILCCSSGLPCSNPQNQGERTSCYKPPTETPKPPTSTPTPTNTPTPTPTNTPKPHPKPKDNDKDQDPTPTYPYIPRTVTPTPSPACVAVTGSEEDCYLTRIQAANLYYKALSLLYP